MLPTIFDPTLKTHFFLTDGARPNSFFFIETVKFKTSQVFRQVLKLVSVFLMQNDFLVYSCRFKRILIKFFNHEIVGMSIPVKLLVTFLCENSIEYLKFEYTSDASIVGPFTKCVHHHFRIDENLHIRPFVLLGIFKYSCILSIMIIDFNNIRATLPVLNCSNIERLTDSIQVQSLENIRHYIPH